MARRPDPRTRRAGYLEEIAALRARVGEAEDLLRALGRGEVDAIVSTGPTGDQVFTLEGADRPYRLMVETLPEGALSLTGDGAILYANARFAELVGADLDQIIGASITGFIAPHDAARLADAMHRAGDGTARERLELRRADGGLLAVQVALRGLEGDSRRTMVATVTEVSGGSSDVGIGEPARKAAKILMGVIGDVEQRMHLEEQLEHERARLRSVVDASGALIALVDPALRVVMVNRAFTAITGVSEAKAIGLSFDKVIDCSAQRESIDGWFEHEPAGTGQAGNDARPVQFTSRLIDRQGHERTLSVTAAPVFDADGKTANLVFVGVDDTERREAEQALNDAERFATVGEMAGTMAHEISQPLQVINLACESAREELSEASARGDAPDPEFMGQKLGRIAQQIESARRIVDDLRNFVRGSTNRPHGPFDPLEAIRNAIRLTEYGMRQAGIGLSLELPGNLPGVIGNAGQLEQVLINLINNARDSVGALQDRQAARTIEVSASLIGGGGTMEIAVADSGPGIPSHVLPHLFNSFITTKPHGKGTGLGLRICRRIVAEMHGQIRATNRPQGGARFEVTLPVAAPDPEGDGRARTGPAALLSAKSTER
jgi:PAS domain S-box-containing protein